MSTDLDKLRAEWSHPDEHEEHNVIHELADEIALLRLVVAEERAQGALIVAQRNLLQSELELERAEHANCDEAKERYHEQWMLAEAEYQQYKNDILRAWDKFKKDSGMNNG